MEKEDLDKAFSEFEKEIKLQDNSLDNSLDNMINLAIEFFMKDFDIYLAEKNSVLKDDIKKNMLN